MGRTPRPLLGSADPCDVVWMPSPPERMPGDLILDRYAPKATPEQREQGRAALLNHARALLRLGERLYAER